MTNDFTRLTTKKNAIGALLCASGRRKGGMKWKGKVERRSGEL